jgi:hypothetical protein
VDVCLTRLAMRTACCVSLSMILWVMPFRDCLFQFLLDLFSSIACKCDYLHNDFIYAF